MGRQHHHHIKLPEHLYLSPPQTPTSAPSGFLSFKSAPSPVTLISETSSAVGDKIPGFKTSAAFLTSLRANLSLASGYTTPTSHSQTSTPDCLRPTNMASSVSSLGPPSPSPPANAPEYPPQEPDRLADVPDLVITPATSDEGRITALKLLADSVAQQRSPASKAMIYHPLTLALIVLVGALAQNYFHKGANSDWALFGTTMVGIVMAGLVAVRGLTNGYVEEAERVGTWKWLDQGRDAESVVGKDDEILLTSFGEETIGTVIFRGVREGESNSDGVASSPKKSRKSSGPVKGVIRGWTVKQRYRGKGVGTALLEEVVKICKEKGWSGPIFADNHANSHRVLHKMFNSGFERRETKARACLEKVIEASSASAGRRKR